MRNRHLVPAPCVGTGLLELVVLPLLLLKVDSGVTDETAEVQLLEVDIVIAVEDIVDDVAKQRGQH